MKLTAESIMESLGTIPKNLEKILGKLESGKV